jgi:hypothetical protein
MKHKYAAWIAGAGVGISAGVGILHISGYVPLWIYAVVLVLLFPVVILALFFWWMALDGKEDIPFIGY